MRENAVEKKESRNENTKLKVKDVEKKNRNEKKQTGKERKER